MSSVGTKYDSISTMRPQQPQEHYDILVVGKSGNGKSTVCNTLLGEEKFAVGRGMSTTTRTATAHVRRLPDKTVQIIDTPDVVNCNMGDGEARAEIRKWKDLIVTNPPSLVLVTVRCDVRYTQEDFQIFQEIQRLWVEKSLTANLAVAFTFGDLQDNDISNDVNDPFPMLKKILFMAKKRYMVFNAKGDRAQQAHECFEMLGRKKRYSEDDGCSCCVIL